MRNTKNVRWCILALAICSALLTGCEPRAKTEATYAAWCKYNKRTDLTIDEWQLLRENYMLPGGDAKRAADDAAAAQATASMAIGISAANAASK